MTYLIERLTELRMHLEHLNGLKAKVTDASVLRSDLSLHNDVLFSLLMVCQLVIDIAGEMSAARGLRFESYTDAVRNLESYEELSEEVVGELAKLPGFRNVLVHEYVFLDLDRAVEALQGLEPVERFAEAVRKLIESQEL